ncbi:dienelactone hydrolase family protein [Neisseria sp. 27098_8_139]|uniref:dienelactone hydrolase family protein n=1 Tax=unclassified Neisseria TaxID=2623750 RepID=UPI00352EC6E1
MTERFDKTKQYPVIVVVHPGGGVKEQTVGVCVRKLTEVGFLAVANSVFGKVHWLKAERSKPKGRS